MTPTVVHSLAELLSALDKDPGGQPLFASPRNGLPVLGGAAWAEIGKQARAERPDRNFRLVVDASASPGEVLAAFSAGCEAVRFTGPESVAVKLADIASAHGALLIHDAEDAFYGGKPNPDD